MQVGRSDQVIADWHKELLGFLREMSEFNKLRDPVEILIKLSGYSVRARYMSSVAAASGDNREIREFRFEEIIPFLQEAEFQRQVWSRVGTLIKDEWEMSKG